MQASAAVEQQICGEGEGEVLLVMGGVRLPGGDDLVSKVLPVTDQGNDHAGHQRPEGCANAEQGEAGGAHDEGEEGARFKLAGAEAVLEGSDEHIDHGQAGQRVNKGGGDEGDKGNGVGSHEAKQGKGDAVDKGGYIAAVLVTGVVGGANGGHGAGDIGVMRAEQAGNDAADARGDGHAVGGHIIALTLQHAHGLGVFSADDQRGQGHGAGEHQICVEAGDDKLGRDVADRARVAYKAAGGQSGHDTGHQSGQNTGEALDDPGDQEEGHNRNTGHQGQGLYAGYNVGAKAQHNAADHTHDNGQGEDLHYLADDAGDAQDQYDYTRQHKGAGCLVEGISGQGGTHQRGAGDGKGAGNGQLVVKCQDCAQKSAEYINAEHPGYSLLLGKAGCLSGLNHHKTGSGAAKDGGDNRAGDGISV
ncbi:hypothetical protein SDC9_114425 [bioreactor metagenome]|uniref:Uncharacterized protein n=1 Tax=bioreactor metagenome TaxID=1076179 RepID=A0A645BQM0_9ZZZZ